MYIVQSSYKNGSYLNAVIRFLVGEVPGSDGDDEKKEKENKPEVEAARRGPGLSHSSILVCQMGRVVILISA